MSNTKESATKSAVLLAYVPVIHRGYLNLFDDYSDVEQIYILGSDILETFDWLRKDIRAISPQQTVVALRALFSDAKRNMDVQVISLGDLKKFSTQKNQTYILPDEDIMHQLAETYLPQQEVLFAQVFLRWEKTNILQQTAVLPSATLPISVFEQQVMQQAVNLSQRSADWWRQVGAIITKDGQVVLSAFNTHVPDQYQTAFQGDPRSNFKKGINIELTTALHAESAVIAEAAKRGIPLDGAEIFVTTFPCPVCAKLIAYSGIRKLYFIDGYSMVDGESILKEKHVELTQLSVSASQF